MPPLCISGLSRRGDARELREREAVRARGPRAFLRLSTEPTDVHMGDDDDCEDLLKYMCKVLNPSSDMKCGERSALIGCFGSVGC